MITMELFIELYDRASVESHGGRSDVIVKKMLGLLDNSNNFRLDPKMIVAAMNMNYNYLSGVFKKETGLSITRYCMKSRIYKAVRLLRESNMNISQISYELGFSSPYHFSNTFKKFMNVSPSDYIKQVYR